MTVFHYTIFIFEKLLDNPSPICDTIIVVWRGFVRAGPCMFF